MSSKPSLEEHQSWAKNFTSTFYRDSRTAKRLAELKARGRTDWDVLRENHRFLRDDEEDARNAPSKLQYEELVALKYYNQLFKEFAVIDLKHYKSGNVALRWRTEEELLAGIGQFTCGGIRCEHHKAVDDYGRGRAPQLTTYQLDFAYQEPVAGADRAEVLEKQALVKVILCKRCGKKLDWKREQDKKRASTDALRRSRSPSPRRSSNARDAERKHRSESRHDR